MSQPVAVDGLLLDFEDACVESVRRDARGLQVVFGDIRVAADDSRVWTRQRVEIVFDGCTSETARYFVGAGVTVPHPDATLPLDFVQTYEFCKGRLVLEGQLAGEPWFVWEIEASGLRVLATSPI